MAKRPQIGENMEHLQRVCLDHKADFLVLIGRKCPDCKDRTVFCNSQNVYGKGTDFGDIYLCTKCGAYVGCHKGTNKAYGRVAQKPLRNYRKEAHRLFDGMWQIKMRINPGMSKTKARRKAYTWLSKEMGLPIELTHIGMFDIPQCQQVIKSCKTFNKRT